MIKPGRSVQWGRQRLLRLGETRTYRRFLRPIVSVLRWEGVILLGALGFALVSVLATRWFFLFVVLALAFLCVSWVRAFDEGAAGERFRHRTRTAGLWIWGVLLLLVGASVFLRFSSWWSAALFALVYLCIWVWHIAWLRRRESQAAMQFKQVVALSVTPVVAAWIVNSTIYLGYAQVVTTLTVLDHEDTNWEATRNQRQAEIDRWEREDSRPIAVALSGGGYRAAAVHAGLLWALDGGGVPVHYLSTVSGGSIVGGTYALGWSPEAFRDHLKKRKPGLPNDFANFYPVFKQLLLPGYGSGDTYAAHFDRVYFLGRRLKETGPPLLILNATRYRDGTRKAFRRERDGERKLARMVAASGAFPVVFDPVRVGSESYVDGGVVENLGIAGLQHYFRDHGEDADLQRKLPGVLIISDVSLIPDGPRSWKKPSVPQMALYAQQASYFAMHQWIYSFYTDGAYTRTGSSSPQQPFAVEAGRLWPGLPAALQDHQVQVFVLSPASPAERRHYVGNERLLDAVSAFQTLEELKPDEVDAAFWVGARLAQVYLADICAAAGGKACNEVSLPEAPPVPRSLERLLETSSRD